MSMSRSGRVAFFTDTYKPNVDGVVKSITLLQNYLEKSGVDVHIFAPARELKYIDNDKEVFFASIPFLPYKEYHIAFPRLKLIEKKGPFDVVHNHGIAFTAMAALASAERFSSLKVSTFHTDITQAVHYVTKGLVDRPFVKAVEKYLKWLYSKFDVITAPSSFAAKKLEKIGLSPVVVPNGIELKKFKIVRRPRKNLLIHVGRVVKEKNLELIFDMIEGTPYKLVVIGKGPALGYYKKIVQSRKLNNITFTGFLPDTELQKFRSQAHAMVFASTFDTQGLVVAEALASGLPVVAYKHSAGAEVVGEFGTVFADKEGFVEAVEKAWALHPTTLVEKAKEFDIRRIAKKWLEIYEL